MNNKTLKIRLKLKRNLQIIDNIISENLDYIPSLCPEYDRLEIECKNLFAEWKTIDPAEYNEYFNTEKLIIF
jgi:hypothetical protein